MPKINKAMILCAGLGTRLKPYTKKHPKPLIPVLNIPSIVYVIELLKKDGIKNLIINLHAHSNQIKNYLGNGKKLGVKIQYSYEKKILGTLGGLKKVEKKFNDGHFINVNCDLISNLNLNKLIYFHKNNESKATLLLKNNKKNIYSRVGINSLNQIIQLGKIKTGKNSKRGFFGGISIIDSNLLSPLKLKFSSLTEDLFSKMIFQKNIYGYFLPLPK